MAAGSSAPLLIRPLSLPTLYKPLPALLHASATRLLSPESSSPAFSLASPRSPARRRRRPSPARAVFLRRLLADSPTSPLVADRRTPLPVYPSQRRFPPPRCSAAADPVSVDRRLLPSSFSARSAGGRWRDYRRWCACSWFGLRFASATPWGRATATDAATMGPTAPRCERSRTRGPWRCQAPPRGPGPALFLATINLFLN